MEFKCRGAADSSFTLTCHDGVCPEPELQNVDFYTKPSYIIIPPEILHRHICDASVTTFCNTARNPPNGQPAGRPAPPSGGTLLCQASSWRGAAGKGESEFKTIGADIIIVSLLNTFFRLRWRVADTFPDLFPSRCDSWTDLGGKIIQNPFTFSEIQISSILHNATMLNPFSLCRPNGRIPVYCHGG